MNTNRFYSQIVFDHYFDKYNIKFKKALDNKNHYRTTY